MTGFWLASFIVLWVVVVSLALVILAMAREIEDMHRRLESMSHYMASYPVEKSPKDESITALLVSEEVL